MKYLLIIYDKPETRALFMSEEGKPLMEEMMVLMDELRQSGEMVLTEGLADPSQTKTVKPENGVPVVTDGPLAEAKEHFGGFLLVDVESMDRAVEIATRFPGARMSPVEVRPLMSEAGSEMET
jgi:hypothetical protein